MKRRKLTSIKSRLAGKGVTMRRESGGDIAIKIDGKVLFFVSPDSMFDGDGNYFDCDL